MNKVFQAKQGSTEYELVVPTSYLVNAELHRFNSDGETVVYFPQDLLRRYIVWRVEQLAAKAVARFAGWL